LAKTTENSASARPQNQTAGRWSKRARGATSVVALLDRLPQELVAGEVAVAEVELHLGQPNQIRTFQKIAREREREKVVQLGQQGGVANLAKDFLRLALVERRGGGGGHGFLISDRDRAGDLETGEESLLGFNSGGFRSSAGAGGGSVGEELAAAAVLSSLHVIFYRPGPQFQSDGFLPKRPLSMGPISEALGLREASTQTIRFQFTIKSAFAQKKK